MTHKQTNKQLQLAVKKLVLMREKRFASEKRKKAAVA
jgi:hypothetical protein